MFNLDKLVGRENFTTWKFGIKTYLEHEDLWKCVEPGPTEKVDPALDIKAKSKIILLISAHNYIHVQDCKTAQEVWQSLHKAFDDNGLTRKVGLLRELINTTLESSNGIEDYVGKIMNASHKLRNINFEVNDEWLGTLLLAGLPDEYKPMIMGLENSGAKITADFVKTKLLQEVRTSDASTAFYTSSTKLKKYKKKSDIQSNTEDSNKMGKGPRCYSCNGFGHIAKYCRKSKKTQDKRESSNFVAAFSATLGGNTSKWYIDSGASMHMCSNKKWMHDVREPSVKYITVANSEPLSVEAEGNVSINISKDNKILVRNVLFVPGLAANLISVSTIAKSGFRAAFHAKGCDIIDKNGKLICSATLFDKLYVLNTHSDTETAHLTDSNEKCDSTNLWHLRMAHLNFSDVKKLPLCAEGVQLEQGGRKESSNCSSCLEGKQARLPFNHFGTRASRPLELIHSDLCGPMESMSYGGMKYFISFIDDYTRMVHVYFLKDKLNILDTFKAFKERVENQLEFKIKAIRTDNGTEYCNSVFESFLTKCGIIHQTTTPYTPQHNGMAERMNRTLVEKAKCMIFYANLDKPIWAEAIATAMYIVNRSPSRALEGKSPYELWTGKKPNLSHIRIFGSEVMVHVPKERRQKWDRKSNKMIFVGYCDNTKGYRVMNPKTHQITKSRDVVFFENSHLHKENMISVLPESTSSSEKKTQCQSIETHTQDSVTTPQSTFNSEHNLEGAECEEASEYETDSDDVDETYCPPAYLKYSQVNQSNVTLRPRNKNNNDQGLLCLLNNSLIPETVEQALSSPYAEEWKKAMDDEYESLLSNETWTLAELPSGKKALPSKWVFATKTDNSGNIVRFKARLVVKGCAQKRGIDYDEVYSPVVRYTSIRYLCALAAKYNLQIDQMDAVSAFLQGTIDTDIYMLQPEMYENGTQVCHLRKSIYGLKQASRLWNIKLRDVLKELGIKQSKTDSCVYYDIEKKIYIAIWVDDLMIFCLQNETKNELKENLKQKLNVKDLGKASQCVGLNITRSEDAVMLDQEKYIREMLTRFNMSDCKPVRTPAEVGLKLTEDSEPVTKECPYQQLVGCLLYLAQGTRPDISFIVNALSRFNKAPTSDHWVALKRVLRYLQGTKDYKLTYTNKGQGHITGYCDADWASDVRDRKSCSGYVFLLQGGAISWCSRKQQTVALSTAEAEYMSMSTAAQEGLWLRQLEEELGERRGAALDILSDNQSAIKLTMSDCYLPRSKHIDIRYHFIREHVSRSRLKFSFVKGSKNVSDILTKPTSVDKHLFCLTEMGLRSGEGVGIRTQPY